MSKRYALIIQVILLIYLIHLYTSAFQRDGSVATVSVSPRADSPSLMGQSAGLARIRSPSPAAGTSTG